MTESRWFVGKDGQKLDGTFSAGEVVALMTNNPGADFVVWRDGMARWSEPSTVPEFAELVTATPPPPPLESQGPAIPPPPPLGSQESSARGTSTAAKKEVAPSATFGPARRYGTDFIHSLFDLKFEAYVTPKIITVVYVIGIILGGIWVVVMLVLGLDLISKGVRLGSTGMMFFGFLRIVFGPVLAIFFLAFFRMFLELVIVIFKIKDGVTTIAERKP